MKKNFILTTFIALCLISQAGFAQTVYATLGSSSWATIANWETYPNYTVALAATPGSGTAATSVPSGTHNVLIRNGHTITMGAANRGCKSMIIQSTGKLWAAETTARRLQMGAGGTGFTYPLIDTLQVDGVLGGPNDGVFLESGAAAQTIKVFGSGTFDILRIRTAGGNGAADATTPGVLNFDIDANINLWQAANYAFSVVYNPAATDNYFMTIFPGKTVAIKDPTGTFHNSQNSVTYGKYTYVIKGILDIASTTATSSVIAPAPAAARITLNVDGGQFKLGTAFRADTSTTSPVSAGILELNAKNGGIVDATPTTNFNVNKTTDGAGGTKDLVFGTDATSSIKRTVGSSEVNFPVGVTGDNNANDVTINNTGVSDVFTVSVKSVFDFAVPNPTMTVNRQWTINEATAGGTIATIRLSWITTHQPSGFNPAGNVYIMRYNGSAWESVPASVTGSGSPNDPYVASASGFVAFSPFTVSNTPPLPISFTNIKAYQRGNAIQVEWANATETNMSKYVVERSKDGRTFSEAALITPTANNNGLAAYIWLDVNPLSGTNFYRIQGVEKDGNSKYTAILKVNITGKSGELTIAPNPVRGSVVLLQINNMDKGNYAVNIFNAQGQKVYNTTINYAGGASAQSLQLPANFKAGMYSLQLRNGSQLISKSLIVE